jgi:uncharacterized membrane protein
MKRFLEKFSDYYIIFCVYALIGWLYEVLWMWFVVPPHHFINRGVLFGPFLPIYGFGLLILLLLLGRFMKKKHPASNPIYTSISLFVIITFIYTTIIEYTTTPKILNPIDYLKDYGLVLVILNVVIITLVNIFIKKTKSKKIKNFNTTIFLVFLLIWIITTVIEYVSHFAIDKMSHKLLWDYTKDFLNINARVNWDASRNFAIGGTFLLYTIQPLINKLLVKLKANQKLLITIVIGIPMLLDFIINVVLK